MDPFRLQVLKALTDVLLGVTPANGFQHDLTGRVFRGRQVFGADDPIPMVSILEPADMNIEVERPNLGGAFHARHDLLIQGFAEDDHDNPTDPAYRLLADVQKVIAQENRRGDSYDVLGFGGRVKPMKVGQPVVRPPDGSVADTAFFWLMVSLDYAENHLDPFA